VRNPLKDDRSQSKGPRWKKFLRPIWIISVLLLITGTLTVLYLGKIESSSFFPGKILVLTLLELNLILLIVLVLLLSRNLIKHYFERRQKLFGTGFRGKLITAFVGFSSIPAILLLIVASGLLTSSVDNWFGIQVERPVENALQIAQIFYEEEEGRARNYAKNLSSILSAGNLTDGGKQTALLELLEAKRVEYQVAGIELYFQQTVQPLRFLDPEFTESAFPPPSQEILQKGFSGREFVEKPLTPSGNLIRAVSPVRFPKSGSVQALLFVDVLIPENLVQSMEEITRSSEDYKQLKTFKNPIKEGYLLSFGIITLVILFSATWFGFFIAKGITGPLQQLAEGTRAIAQGDLSFRIKVKASDELGILVNSFNKMTEDLQAGKTQLDEVNRSLSVSNLELDQRRTYIETVLQNIGTGIISLDRDDRVTTVNYAAEQIFQIRHQDIRGKFARDAFQALNLHPIMLLMEEMDHRQSKLVQRDLQIEVQGMARTVSISITQLQSEVEDDLGKVMVVEDLTELIKAQKAAAWQEVAQHIAHEIKNPLTPIQLSAQRMRKKHAEKSEDFPQVFEESTTTIMNEVSSLKQLVDEFSRFARLPAPQFSRQNIHSMLQEVILLYQGAHRGLKIETQLDSSIPPLNLDREQFRRVFVNLFENAVEATQGRGHLWINSLLDKTNKKANITIADDGPGILPGDQDKLFLPSFSRKKTGTGLGLAITHRIVTEHNGNIKIANREPHGTQVVLELPI